MPRNFIITISFILIVSLIAFTVKFLQTMTHEQFGEVRQIGTRDVCPTRNQSYDIRGDIPIPRKSWPVFNATIGPSQPDMCRYSNLE